MHVILGQEIRIIKVKVVSYKQTLNYRETSSEVIIFVFIIVYSRGVFSSKCLFTFSHLSYGVIRDSERL